nr:TetR/AcrR family transcriptional regulator [uncultured Albidiferax sp.]
MENTTRTKIMEAAEQLLRTRGYSDFSYADLVEQAGIRKPSIHHHFPTKEDLGVAIVSDYLVIFKATLDDTLVCQPTAADRLASYAEFFTEILEDGSFPLCTALAAELGALPKSMRDQTVQFFNMHLAWLEKVVDIGKAKGEFTKAPDGEHAAKVLLSAIEGGAVVGWALSRPEVVRSSFDEIISLWSDAPKPHRSRHPIKK